MSELRELQGALYDLLLEVKRICEKHNIKYFLAYGTLLGAIRHKGFIPWDDDLDIGMVRKEYDRFLQVSKTELNDPFYIVNYQNEVDNSNFYSKIKIKGTTFVEEISKDNNQSKEIFIDIFPFDNAPTSDCALWFLRIRMWLINRMYAFKCGVVFDNSESKSINLFNKVISILSKFYGKKNLSDKAMKIATKYNKEQSDSLIYAFSSLPFKKARFPRQSLENTIQCLFEEDYFSVPSGYDEFLSTIYGDYMQLPPKNKRRSNHGRLEMDLGQYKVKSELKEIGDE